MQRAMIRTVNGDWVSRTGVRTNVLASRIEATLNTIRSDARVKSVVSENIVVLNPPSQSQGGTVMLHVVYEAAEAKSSNSALPEVPLGEPKEPEVQEPKQEAADAPPKARKGFFGK